MKRVHLSRNNIIASSNYSVERKNGSMNKKAVEGTKKLDLTIVVGNSR